MSTTPTGATAGELMLISQTAEGRLLIINTVDALVSMSPALSARRLITLTAGGQALIRRTVDRIVCRVRKGRCDLRHGTIPSRRIVGRRAEAQEGSHRVRMVDIVRSQVLARTADREAVKVRATMDVAAGTEATVVDQAAVIIHASFLRIQEADREWAVTMVVDDHKVAVRPHIRRRKAAVDGLLLALRQAGMRTNITRVNSNT